MSMYSEEVAEELEGLGHPSVSYSADLEEIFGRCASLPSPLREKELVKAILQNERRFSARRTQRRAGIAMRIQRQWGTVVAILALVVLPACTVGSTDLGDANLRSSPPKETATALAPQESRWVTASYYGAGDGFAGKKTASGEVFNPREMTAAHRTMPFGTKLRLKNPENGRQVDVRINDRGPAKKSRDLDVSVAAAEALGLKEDGVKRLQITSIDR